MRKLIFIIMFSFLKTLFGCKENAPETANNTGADTGKIDFKKMMDDFENRPIHKVLTKEIIDQTSDRNLLQVVFDNLSEKLPDDYEKEFGTVLTWNKSRQAIYIIWMLEAEVNNGGFNQYYFNSTGAFAKFAPDALKLVGAEAMSSLVMRANDIFKKQYDSISKHQDGTLEGFSKSYENNPLNALDDEFYDLEGKERLGDLQVKYIRTHIDQFIDK